MKRRTLITIIITAVVIACTDDLLGHVGKGKGGCAGNGGTVRTVLRLP